MAERKVGPILSAGRAYRREEKQQPGSAQNRSAGTQDTIGSREPCNMRPQHAAPMTEREIVIPKRPDHSSEEYLSHYPNVLRLRIPSGVAEKHCIS